MSRVGGHAAPEHTGAWWWVRHVAAWLVILAVAAALTLAMVVPRLTGSTPYTITSGSMRPELAPGTLVVVRPTAADDIGVGDVITYQLRSGRAPVVTHRVVAVRQSPDGSRAFVTRGDANAADDAALVRPVQVRGTLWYAVPRLGRLGAYLTAGERTTALGVVVAGLLLFSVRMFVEASRDRRRERVDA